jgi:hypothetical protein
VTRAEPTALRLVVTGAALLRPPKPPFGLAAWSQEVAGAAYVLDFDPNSDPNVVESLAALARLVPPASELPSGTPVVLFGTRVHGFSWWKRLASRASVRIGRAERCSALLVRGYVDVSAATDTSTGEDLAWAWAP